MATYEENMMALLEAALDDGLNFPLCVRVIRSEEAMGLREAINLTTHLLSKLHQQAYPRAREVLEFHMIASRRGSSA